MTMSAYVRDGIVNHLFNQTALAVPSAWYVQCHVGSPGVAGTANPSTAYTSRVQCNDWTASSGGGTSNVGAVLFTGAAAGETITYVSVWDAASGGNCLGFGPLAVAKTVGAGDSVNFAAGEVDVLFQ